MHVTVNGLFPVVYMSYMNNIFSVFHLSSLSVLNFRIFLFLYLSGVIVDVLS